MKKKLVCILALCLILGVFTGCDVFGGKTISANSEGWAEGKIGDTFQTEWFTFSIESAEFVEQYAGYSPENGYLLLDTVLTLKNTDPGPDMLPMFDYDFWIQWGDDETGGAEYCLDQLDSTMMPMEFEMDIKQEATYHLVFEVPEETRNEEFTICYIELYLGEEGQDIEELYGDWFGVNFTVN